MKKLLSIFLCLIMFGTPTTFVSAAETKTSESNALTSAWAVDSIEKAKNIGLINGDCNFTAYITREEFCELIYNYIMPIFDISKVSISVNKFTDTDNEHIQKLNEMGIINGKSETEFAPDDSLTREEAATIILRLIKTVHSDWSATEVYFEFTDNNEISDWADIQIICNLGIMNGVGGGAFAPKENITVEQAVAILVRCYERLNSNVIIGGSEGETDIVIADLSFSDKLNIQMPTNKNYMFSPISIKMALALAANGADGNTKEEILNAMDIENIDEFNETSKELIYRYSQTDTLSLKIANSIWMNNDKTSQKFNSSFKNTVSNYYNAEVKSVNNKNAVSEINSWVSDKTNGKISQIVNSSDDFWAMLVNAVYFKGNWRNEFSERATKSDEFINADETTSRIDFMNTTAWMNYAETKSAKIVELPYQNRVDTVDKNGIYVGTEKFDNIDVSMYVISSDNDINVEEELEAVIEDNNFKSTYTKLSMPKFKIEYSGSLNDMLMNIGIQSAFEPKAAQFEKMFDSGKMWITETIHKTFINVDEKGTEAAAVTAISMGTSSIPPEPTEIKFDKPFYFVIRDNTSGEVLFMGRFAYAE